MKSIFMYSSKTCVYIPIDKYNSYSLTPRRNVGDDAICDKIGPRLWATGTRTGENRGTAELASC